MTPDEVQAATGRLVALFEAFAPGDVPRLGDFYAPQAWFKDPFNEVTGLEAIQRLYAHMFDVLDTPRFTVLRSLAQADACLLEWEFHFSLRNWPRAGPQMIRGASVLTLDDSGRIVRHRDYWDAAEEVHAKLPLIGSLMRWLARRAAV